MVGATQEVRGPKREILQPDGVPQCSVRPGTAAGAGPGEDSVSTANKAMMSPNRIVVYVDVDDTLVRSAGSKRIPMTRVVAHVRALFRNGVALYAWSSGGADYARTSTRELGIEECFLGFLPKPNVLIDDQAPGEWRRFIHIHPLDAASKTADNYSVMLES